MVLADFRCRSMIDALSWMDDEQKERASRSLDRRVMIRDFGLVNFASNDYLGLANDPRVIDAAKSAADQYGFGSGASPLVSGWTRSHQDLADALVSYEQVEAVALFSSGFAANLGTIAALVGKGDAVYLDRLNHACLIDGAKLSGASLRVFPHNDADRLEAILARDQGRFRRSLVAVDGVFSMDGDLAPLDRISEICERFDAMLMVDEAHGTGVFGPNGRGACEHFHVTDRVHVRVGTLSKALGSLGGFVAGSRRLVDHLINRSRTMIYSTALPSACCAAANEAVKIAIAEPGRRERVHRVAIALRTSLQQNGWKVIPSTGPIVPVWVGDPAAAVAISQNLRDQGLHVPAIRPPTVPEGTSRLRISLTASHSDEELARLVRALGVAAPAKVR